MVYNIAVNPELKDLSLGTFNLRYCKHAIDSCIGRGITKLKDITINGNVVEAETGQTGALTKVVVRVPHDNQNDTVLVLQPSKRDKELIVITTWLNDKNDLHQTLNKSRLGV